MDYLLIHTDRQTMVILLLILASDRPEHMPQIKMEKSITKNKRVLAIMSLYTKSSLQF